MLKLLRTYSRVPRYLHPDKAPVFLQVQQAPAESVDSQQGAFHIVGRGRPKCDELVFRPPRRGRLPIVHIPTTGLSRGQAFSPLLPCRPSCPAKDAPSLGCQPARVECSEAGFLFDMHQAALKKRRPPVTLSREQAPLRLCSRGSEHPQIRGK